MKKRKTINVKGSKITILQQAEGDFISLTDMIQAKDGDFFISDWLRNRNTVEFLGIWETVYNPNFNYGEFAIIKSKAGLSNMESINALLIEQNLLQKERLIQLNNVAITQMKSLLANDILKPLK